MIVPLPQSGQGWPTKASTPPVAEGVEAIVATGAGEPGKSAFTSFVVFSAFGFFSFGVLGFPVSYTHLRAHETDSYLVCRLLLEKKKNKETHSLPRLPQLKK